jgi:hypothetical protein
MMIIGYWLVYLVFFLRPSSKGKTLAFDGFTLTGAGLTFAGVFSVVFLSAFLITLT